MFRPLKSGAKWLSSRDMRDLEHPSGREKRQLNGVPLAFGTRAANGLQMRVLGTFWRSLLTEGIPCDW
jgi:hypothetical protein